jgi:hypothetical protein
MYNRLYEADNSIGPHGEAAVDGLGNPIDLDLTVYANVHRFIYSTDYEVFGAKYAWNFVIPLVAVDVNLTNYGINETEFRIADFNIEPIVIEWHEPRYDFGYVYGLFAPTAGRNDARPAIPGKAHWTNYVGAAGTYYFDDDRTWAASILSRYEIASKRDDKDIRPGDNFSFEWGLSRNFDKTLDIGVSGYCSWQLTLDKGSDVTYTNVRDRVYGIGPEINYFSPKLNLGYNLRYWWEFEAVDRPQGTIACLTIVKPY